jgi:diguanylate cyclase
MLALTAMGLAYMTGIFVNWGSSADRLMFANLGVLPMGLTATILAWSASRMQTDRRSTWAWRLVSLSFGCFFTGDALFFMYQNLLGQSPFPSWADAGYLAYYPLMLAGLLFFPSSIRDRLHRAMFGLDGLIIFLGGGMVVSYFFLIPTLSSAGDDLLAYSLSVGYPIGDLLLLGGVAYLLLRSGAKRTSVSLVLLSAGLIIGLAADVQYGWENLQGLPQAGGLSDAGYMLSWGLFAWAGYMEFARGQRPDGESVQVGTPWLGSALPYAFIGVGLALLIYATRSLLDTQAGFIIYADTALVLIVVARQILARRETGRQAALAAASETERRFHNELEHRTQHDGLTGLANRDRFMQSLRDAVDPSNGAQGGPALALLDLDGFGEVNRRWGHTAGDELLVAVARRMESLLGPKDCVARLGSDEFAVLLDGGVDAQTARALGDNLVAMGTMPFALDADEINVTVSVGLALAGSEGSTAEGLLRSVNAALRAAKVHGKNRMEVHGCDS